MAGDSAIRIQVNDLDIGYGATVIQRDIAFTVERGSVFVVMGGSGCGKSTLLKNMVGLEHPLKGDIYYDGEGFWGATPERRQQMSRRFGILFQSGALWSSMTLAENVALPLREYTKLSAAEIAELVSLKLALVGLRGREDFYPSELSGGQRKRAGLARAMALDPAILFFDEPSAGLDPISSKRLDDLILELRDSLAATVIVVTHELASIFDIADDSLFLDAETRRPIARGNPKRLLAESRDPKVLSFLKRETPPVG